MYINICVHCTYSISGRNHFVFCNLHDIASVNVKLCLWNKFCPHVKMYVGGKPRNHSISFLIPHYITSKVFDWSRSGV